MHFRHCWKFTNFKISDHMFIEYVIAFLCNSCNFHYLILGWSSRVLGLSTHILISCCDEGSLLLCLRLLLFTVFRHLQFHSCPLPEPLGSLVTSKPTPPLALRTTPTDSRPGGLLPQRRVYDSPLSMSQCIPSIVWGRCWVAGLGVWKLGTCHRTQVT